jgi:diaminobutyrate-2-oxoglutarate transaminase
VTALGADERGAASDALARLSFPDAPSIVAPPPGPASTRLLDRQARRESNARTYPRGLPIALAEGRGATVRDVDGNLYIDCLGGAGALNVGHDNPFVREEVERFLRSGHALMGLDLPSEPRDRFTDALLSVMPPELGAHARLQFCGPTGSDAVDAALKLAKWATGRHEVIAFQGAYHGMGQGPLSTTGATAPKSGLGALLAAVHFAPYGHCARCALGLTVDRCGLACARMLGSMLEDPWSGVTTPAAIIVEAIQGEGGSVVPPEGWLRLVGEYARANDVPLVCDEVQTGFGRTGRWFAFEHDGIVPDVVVLSKAVGGGGYPLSVVVYHERLDDWPPGAHAGTFRGNYLAMAAGTAAIGFIRSHGLVEHAASLGARLLGNLRSAGLPASLVSDIRGRGLLIGVETTSTATAHAVRRESLLRGLIVELGGRQDRTVRLLPPLVLTERQADRVVDVLAAAFRAAGRD